MTTTLVNLVDRVRYQLSDRDADNYRWENNEFVHWVNDAVRAIILTKPDANYTVIAHALAAGALQQAPAGALAVIDVPCNMGAGGATPGRAISLIEKAMLDTSYPGWPAAAAAAEIEHWIYNPSAPRHWMCFPPSDGTGQVRIIYSLLPDAVTDVTTGNFPLTDEYVNAAVLYIAHRCLAKDADYAPGAERARMELIAFYQELGRMDLAEMIYRLNAIPAGQSQE